MKKILGLDLGTTSIGWALVNEAENKSENSEIIKLGVRVNPLSIDEKTNFDKGKPISTNADRTLNRGARRNLQRYKQRRENLFEILLDNKLITKETILTETGNNTTHETLRLRAKAPNERIELDELARVFFSINKKRGYKSSRKAKSEDEGNAIDGMSIAKELYENNITPGQYVYELLLNKKKYIPDFYRSDLQNEFNIIWEYQKQFHSNVLNDEMYKKLEGQGQQNSRKRFLAIHGIYTAENKGKRDAIKLQHYKWRAEAITNQLPIDQVAYVLVEINNNLNKSSGYLGAISDRSKELYFKNETVGENLHRQIKENNHTSLRNQVFYRQDYLDEFEQIWVRQAKYYSELTLELKNEIRDVVIFYQRKLKSQKHLISNCQFEKQHKAVPKSSPLFQEFKIWQNLNNLVFKNTRTKEKCVLDDDLRISLFEELNLRGNLTEKTILKFCNLNSTWKSNFTKGLEGNNTNKALYNIYQHIATEEGYGFDWEKKTTKEIKEELKSIFPRINIDTTILNFETNIEGQTFDKQTNYQLWHLLYSAEDDTKILEEDRLVYGNSNVALKKKLHTKYGFKPEYATMMANVTLQDDYGSLSSRAIRKIIPFLQEGNEYSESCALAGYNHSSSLTKEELEKRILKPRLEILQKNSLRNPVVEKILNQMVNVINQIIDEYGKPDEIRIELARDLKKSAKQREETTKFINSATKVNDDIKSVIQKEFGFTPTKNDVVRYKLWLELKNNGYKSLFTNKYIPKEDIFSKNIDIEHIIPKAILFDDSFSNKTLAYRAVNLKKADRTAIDFIEQDYSNEDINKYRLRVESLYKNGDIKKGKYKKLLMSLANLPTDFIARDLVNTQYISKKAKSMLFEVFQNVVPTSGRITDKLRGDWDLINVMKELNLHKYRSLGLTEIQERKNNVKIEIIKDWTKRNDHRHHAMDALTVAFTTHNHINYINNLNASRNKESHLFSIKNTITKVYEDTTGNKKRNFIQPIENFRTEAKKHIESILISFKNKNKVVTKNINKSKLKGKDNFNAKPQLTPRGQLHKETVYGTSKREMDKPIKLSKKFKIETLKLIVNSNLKTVVTKHLHKYNNKPEIAFDSKTIKKDPILYKGLQLTEVLCFEEIYTIRKVVSPDNFKTEKDLNKIIDKKTQEVLKNRLNEFGGKPKEAFSDLDKNPIWLNKEKGISIKRVTITGVSNAEPLHYKKDHFGSEILDKKGNKQAVDFVSTGNNHHVAIYKDDKGKLQEKVVSFYEAVARVNEGLPIINKEYNTGLGWEFLFTMKQNEMFVFPNDDFNPIEIDLLDEKNEILISKNLFRVQKISTKNYMFNHHLETQVVTSEILKTKKQLSGITYHFIQSTEPLRNIIKLRMNHIGKIVYVGEY
ncbi:type II CRISPR RNA-guided endonuclease Cas9 [Lacinutrix jangbogonensis]|uniref:type II CRISPR RNA-guided endonuclease Cas9 n=1 Tax=Lacinutrix jangbogonensis TaxID=1469557 RepID=UPI00053D1252|nr:type II CRISPR RNA-guided endonuclease Cas9 [Lacinutrix jangbogonensis]